ncbi:radical SAM protein, partial [Candidatus Bathyarchaeota archaeon]
MARRRGYKIVLTADRTLMSEYGGGIFMGFSACVPKGLVPDYVYFNFFCPSVGVGPNGEAEVAPCGLRRVEAALLEYGFSEDEVIVAHPDYLDRVIGPETRVLGVNETDPLGIGPATTTFTELFGGEAYMAIKFREIVFHPAVREHGVKIIVGGPGAWQLEVHEEVRRQYDIDCVVVGEAEEIAGPLFEKAVRGEKLPEVVHGTVTPPEKVPNIRRPTVCGIVEIARGCGRGCRFCEPTLAKLRSFPMEKIVKDVEVNVRAGRQPILHAEDVLRYGAKSFMPEKEKVLRLFKAVRAVPGVEHVGMSHFALSSVAAAPDLVEELTPIMGASEKFWASGQTGIETGSPRMIDLHMRGKVKPFRPEEWPEVVVRAFEVMRENYWVPCATLIIGLPGETEKDVELTIDLVERLRPFKSLIVPLFFVAMGALRRKGHRSMELRDLTIRRSELLLKAWKHNLLWAPTLMREYFRMTARNRLAVAGMVL